MASGEEGGIIDGELLQNNGTDRVLAMTHRRFILVRVATPIVIAVFLWVGLLPRYATAVDKVALIAKMNLLLDQLSRDLEAQAERWWCLGQGAKAMEIEATIGMAKENLQANRLGEAFRGFRQAQRLVEGIGEAEQTAARLSRIRTTLAVVIAICSVLVAALVIADSARGDDARQTTKRVKDAVPGYFQLMKNAGCSD